MSEINRGGTFGGLATTLAVAVAAALPAQQGQAQQQGATSLLEEVVVTARRREESLQETPIAVTALAGDTMTSMGIENSTDMAKFIPNMNAMDLGLGGGLGDNYTIRGIGTDRLFPDSESGVGIYIDDVFFPRVAANVVDMVELERVEVLRGPQGTLFGRNSMAGTIRYVTKKPTGEFDANVRATTGSYDRQSIIGSVNFPLSDNWAGLVSFGSDRRDGYITHERGPGTNGSKDNSTIRGKLRYETDRLTVDLGYTETSVRSDGTPIVILSVSQPTDSRGYFPFVGGYNNAFPNNPWDDSWASQGKYSIPGNASEPDYNTMDQTVLEMTINYDISDTLTFRSITAATDLEYEWNMDMDESELPVFTNRFGEENEVFQQEFQLLGESDRFNWQAGVFLYDEQPDYWQWTTATAQENGAERLREQEYQTDAWAVYAQGTYAINDRLSLTAGVRHTDEEKSIYSVMSISQSTSLTQGLNASNTGSWSATTSLLNLAYQATDNLMLYGSYSEGFKGGGMNFNLRPGGFNLGIVPFDPEEADSIELGAKWNSSDGNIIVNAAMFTTDLTGQQLNGTIIGPGGGFIGIMLNAGESSMEGAEIEFTGNLSDNFQLRASAAVFDGGFDSLGTAASVIGLDSDMPNAPELSYTLGGTYDTALSNGGGLTFNFDYAWRDEVQANRNPNNVLTLDDLGILNASMVYHFPGDQLSVTLGGTNLTDEYYFTAFRQRDIQAPFGSTNGNVGRPQEIYVAASFQF